MENIPYYSCYLMGEVVLLRDCHLEDYVERESRQCVFGFRVKAISLLFVSQSLPRPCSRKLVISLCSQRCRGNQRTERLGMVRAGGMMQCFQLTSVGSGDENKVAYSILSCLPSLENAGQRGL